MVFEAQLKIIVHVICSRDLVEKQSETYNLASSILNFWRIGSSFDILLVNSE